ncbi:MAG: hypothetical protein ABIL01_18630 [Pseudomonadota bacterium]
MSHARDPNYRAADRAGIAIFRSGLTGPSLTIPDGGAALDRILQSLPHDMNLLTKRVVQMAIQSNFRGIFTARGAEPAVPHRFGTSGLSGVSDFATHPDGRRRWGTSLKKLVMAIALIACASPAPAETLVATSHCKYSRYYGYDNCRTTWTKLPAPVRDPEQERLDAIALQKEDAKWEAFCKPKFSTDAFGVRRASYATRGCEFGRSE